MTHADVYATVTDRYGETYPEEYVGSVEAWTLEDRATLAPWRKVRRTVTLEGHGLDPLAPGHRVALRFELDGGE